MPAAAAATPGSGDSAGLMARPIDDSSPSSFLPVLVFLVVVVVIVAVTTQLRGGFAGFAGSATGRAVDLYRVSA